MSLVEYADRELKLAGFDDEDADYAGMVRPAVMELVERFANQGHSGYSAGLILGLLERILRFEPLTPLRTDLDEWTHVGESMWQSRRNPEVFSDDGGETWYYLSRGGHEGPRFTSLVCAQCETLVEVRTPPQPRYVLALCVDHADPDPVSELLEAIRLTQEYVQLPARPGWSWYDAYRRHRPADADRLREEAERAETARPADPIRVVMDRAIHARVALDNAESDADEAAWDAVLREYLATLSDLGVFEPERVVTREARS